MSDIMEQCGVGDALREGFIDAGIVQHVLIAARPQELLTPRNQADGSEQRLHDVRHAQCVREPGVLSGGIGQEGQA